MSTVASTSSSSSKQTSQPSKQTQNVDTEFQAETFRRLHPRAYLERFLNEGFRPDARETGDFRDVIVNVGSISTADGSALVRLGNTTIVCGVKAEIAEPELDAPELGFLVPNLDLPAICSPKFKPGPPVDEAQVLSERLYDTLISSDTLPLSSLCIQPRKSVWVLYVDATCINYDGNVFDAALLAIIAALKNTRLSKARFDEDRGRTICSRKEKTTLQLTRAPVAVSFGIFDSTYILADPSAFEEPLLDTSITVIIGENDQLLSVQQSGAGTSSAQDSTLHCIAAARKRRKELAEVIDGIC